MKGMPMRRKAIINFINSEILLQVGVDVALAEPSEIVKMVSAWRVGKQADIEMVPVVDDGALYINGEPVGRIASKTPRVHVSDMACHMEGRILARQESDYD